MNDSSIFDYTVWSCQWRTLLALLSWVAPFARFLSLKVGDILRLFWDQFHQFALNSWRILSTLAEVSSLEIP